MASLYQIDQSILDCIDCETGEIVDIERLDNLILERNLKLENVALWIKNLLSDAEAYKIEKNAFDEREKRARNKAESLKKWLSQALSGEKFQTNKVQISFRKSKAVEFANEDDFIYWAQKNNRDDLLTFKEPSVNKTNIRRELENGNVIEGVEIVERQNISIK